MWSAWTAHRKRYEELRPDMGARFVNLQPNRGSAESAGAWSNPGLAFTNRGPNDYDQVIVELVRTKREARPAVLSMVPIDSTTDWNQTQDPGPMRVGETTTLRVTSNVTGHGGLVYLSMICRKRRWHRFPPATSWLTVASVDLPPVPPRPAIY